MTTVGKDVEKPEPSYIAGGVVKWDNLENGLAVPQNLRHRVTI